MYMSKHGDRSATSFAAGSAPNIADRPPARLLLLAPPHARLPAGFQNVRCDDAGRDLFLAAMQRLRGRVYLEDGAIEPRHLSSGGRHCLPIDGESWHLLALDSSETVRGCVRYRAHDSQARFTELSVRHSAIANCATWGGRFRAAVEAELQRARSGNLSYVEVGGWAIAPERRCTAEALRTALATYSLARILGGCVGITTATARHHSSSILRRIGGSSLQLAGTAIPPYYDPQYRCDMEVLRFDSASPAPRYSRLVDELVAEVFDVPVICTRLPRTLWPGALLQQLSPAVPPISAGSLSPVFAV